jgi:hypothetical protein
MQNNVRILSEHEIKKEDNESKRPSKRKKWGGISKLISTSSLAPNTSGSEEIWKQQDYFYILVECLQIIRNA